jgi:hypothetical protein
MGRLKTSSRHYQIKVDRYDRTSVCCLALHVIQYSTAVKAYFFQLKRNCEAKLETQSFLDSSLVGPVRSALR